MKFNFNKEIRFLKAYKKRKKKDWRHKNTNCLRSILGSQRSVRYIVRLMSLQEMKLCHQKGQY